MNRKIRGGVFLAAPLLLLALLTPTTPASSVVLDAPPEVRAQPADSLVDAVGVQTHLAYPDTPYQDVARTKQALVDLGVRHVRDQMYSNKPALYGAMREIAAEGIRFNVIMGNPISWDTPENLVRTIRDNVPAGVLESLEGANEWNLKGREGWVAELRAHQEALHEAAKADPATADLPILAPSLGMRTGFHELGDLSPFADLGNAHIYPGGQKPSTFIRDVLDAQDHVTPGKPTMVTEGGYHDAMSTESGHRPTPEDVVGVYAPRLLLEHYAAGTERFYLYQLFDERYDAEDTDSEASFGLVRYDYTPKPAYTALKNLLALAADPGPEFTPGTLEYAVDGPADLRHVLLQKRDGTFLLLMWRDVSVWDRVAQQRTPVAEVATRVRLGEPAKTLVHFPTQRPGPVAAVDGTVVDGRMGGEVVALTITPDQPAAPDAAPEADPTPAPDTAPTPSPAPAPITAPATEPGPPVDLYAASGHKSAHLWWSPPTVDGGAPVTGSLVTGSDGSRTQLGADATFVEIRGLKNNASYTFRVQARNEVGLSEPVTVAVTPWGGGKR